MTSFVITRLSNEVLFEIFKCLNSYYKTLFSCLLVNRKWCRIIVPILWRAPCFKYRRVIRMCFLELNADEQALLVLFKINLPENNPMPLFEHVSFIISVNN
ncbi:hypothetical protein F8M41_006462 [Gigaspora margarita]|uniref:F-box domain-containing protein n=1 Tax=Gigaspora margarita TaxID=4874 RepID=A0A8H4A443_GIGMA|nr:hypothetical protein F8M41_006462 [Gigaspora margarita]